jgi:hypothetical protein
MDLGYGPFHTEDLLRGHDRGEAKVEPEVQKEAKVSRSELDTAFDVGGASRWMVVQSLPTTPWGYELWTLDGENDGGVPALMVVP